MKMKLREVRDALMEFERKMKELDELEKELGSLNKDCFGSEIEEVEKTKYNKENKKTDLERIPDVRRALEELNQEIEDRKTTPLSISISKKHESIESGKRSEMVIKVTYKNSQISDAEVVLSAKSGKLSPESGKTDKQGRFVSEYTAPTVTSEETDKITVSVSKSCYKGAESLFDMTISSDRPKITIRRTVYDPVSKDFVSEKKLDYPEVKGWLEARPPPDYWYIMRIDNTGGSVDEWAVELETHLALSVKEAYIEGIDRRFDLRSEHDLYKERHILSVLKDYGIPLQHNGVRRLYFRLNIDCEKALLPVYAIAGRVIAGDDVMPITEKEFPFSCEIRKLKEVMSSSPAEVLDFVRKRAMDYYPLDAATAIVDALGLYNEINELVKGRYVEENILKNKIENLRESLKNVKASTGVGRPLELVEEILDDILPRADVQVTLKRWKAMNLFDVMMTELLKVRA